MPRNPHRPLPIAVAAACLLAATPGPRAQTAPVLPSGAQVRAGQATITTQGAQMTVRNTPGTVLNWQSFNIGAGAGVYFDQANAASRVLNRVTGNDPSAIFGTLASNGQVWLLNPNGVLFGAGARVDVAGLVASTLRLADNDFLAGRYRFAAAEGDAPSLVRNEGTLRTTYGGQLALIGARVENTGDASAPGGQVTLAAGRSVELVDTGLPNLVVRLREGAGEVLNSGRLVADGGRIDLHGAIVNQEGLVRADTLAPDAQGRIVLRASDTLTLGERSVTAATAPVEASAGATAASNARGGSIDLLGSQVAMVGHAIVDVSGSAGGGSIRLGGGARGRDASVPNSRAVYIGANTELRADATGARGDGGSIVVWSDEATRAYGRFSARGGRFGGDGGFVETSGGWLDARPRAMDLSAPAGSAGTWLLDPYDIFITSNPQFVDTAIALGAGPVFTSVDVGSVLTTNTLAAVLNSGTSVSVVTGDAAGTVQLGHIAMRGATLTVAPPRPVTLTLQAHRDIVIEGSVITSGAAPLSLTLAAGAPAQGAPTVPGQGAIEIAGSRIATNGGDVTLGGVLAQTFTRPDGSLTPARAVASTWPFDFGSEAPAPAATNSGLYGVDIRDSTLDLGAGTFRAAGYSQTGVGIRIGASPFSETAVRIDAGRIDLFGVGETVASDGSTGVRIMGDTTLTATQGLRIEGSGHVGVQIDGGARVALNAAAGSGAKFEIVGYGGFGNGVALYADYDTGEGNVPGRGSRITVNNGSFAVQASSRNQDGLVMFNDSGAPGPLLDLTGATSGVFDVTASAVRPPGSTSIWLRDVELALPTAGSTRFSGSLGIDWNAVTATGGAGTLSFSAPAVRLVDSSIAGNGLAVDFAVAGADRQGVRIDGTTIATGGGDVFFGALQTVTSPRLGASAEDRWIEVDGNNVDSPALIIRGSTIDAGGGTVRGGGANHALGAGTEIAGSAIRARRIQLAGRSETWTGLTLGTSTLEATEQLALEGFSAGAGTGTAAGTGLAILAGSTLRLVDPAVQAGSQMRLHGEHRFDGNGLALEGGAAGSGAQPTSIVVQGASLLVEGSSAGGGVGLDLRGNAVGEVILVGRPTPSARAAASVASVADAAQLQAVAPGASGLALDAQGATALTLRGSSSGGTVPGLAVDSVELRGPTAAGAPALVESTGLLSMTGSLLTAGGPVTLRSQGALTLADSALSTAGPLTLQASGAGLNGSLLSVLGTSLIANGLLTLDGRATSGGIGVSLLGGNTLRGADVVVVGAGSGAPGISFDAAAAASTLVATVGNISIDGDPAAAASAVLGTAGHAGVGGGLAAPGGPPSVAFRGGWSVQAADALTLHMNGALPLLAGSLPGSLPTFSAGSAFVLINHAAGGFAIGPGLAVDSAALNSALAGMPVTATTTLRDAAAGGTLAVSGAIDVPSRLVVEADRIDITGGGSVTARGSGDALVLRGVSANTLNGFVNSSTAGAAALAAPNGRWLLLADDPRAVTLGGLLADFTVFGLEGGAGVIPATGNVFGFGVPAVTITGSAGDPATASTISILEATRTAVTMPMAFSTPTKSRLFDAAVALDGGEGQPERTLDWASLPRDEAISLLAARGRYKQKVFAKGVYRLQQDPRLADAPACANEAEAQSGKCIVTEALKRQLLAAPPSSQVLLPSAQALRPGQRRVVRAELPGIERKLALLIGINRYEDQRVPELTGAVPDVRAVRELLEGRLGYETTVLENASRADIVRAFNRLALQAQANDSVIIYYAGHGVVVPMAGIDTGYWLPADVDSEFPQTWLANADIARLVAAIGARQLMLVSDSCYSGTLVGKERVQLHSGAPNADAMLRRRAAVAMSSGGDEPVADSGRGGHSIFAWHFMRALEELDHWQVGGNLFERVKAAVVRDFPQTPQYGASRSAGHQGDTDYLFERRALEGGSP